MATIDPPIFASVDRPGRPRFRRPLSTSNHDENFLINRQNNYSYFLYHHHSSNYNDPTKHNHNVLPQAHANTHEITTTTTTTCIITRSLVNYCRCPSLPATEPTAPFVDAYHESRALLVSCPSKDLLLIHNNNKNNNTNNNSTTLDVDNCPSSSSSYGRDQKLRTLIRCKYRRKQRRILFSSSASPTTTSDFPRPTTTLLLLYLVALLSLAPGAYRANELQTNRQPSKSSRHFQISQICANSSPFPTTKLVEGAVLSSGPNDVDINCTLTLRAKSSQFYVVRFEDLKLGCDDHLKLFDSDTNYGQPPIYDFSCRDNLANVQMLRTTGTFLTVSYTTDNQRKSGDGFRFVATAVFDLSTNNWECPIEYAQCSRLCISKTLFCDGVNHCLNGDDELGCRSFAPEQPTGGSSSWLGGGANGSAGEAITLPGALGLFVMLVLIIFTCVIMFILAIYCRREMAPTSSAAAYAQYQQQLARQLNVALPLQTSSSVMFQPHHHHGHPGHAYQYFQPATMSPFITPTHQPMTAAAAATTGANSLAAFATLPRGYSTMPLNIIQQRSTPVATTAFQPMAVGAPGQAFAAAGKPAAALSVQAGKGTLQTSGAGPLLAAAQQDQPFFMMAGLAPSGTIQTNLIALPTSQSILGTPGAMPQVSSGVRFQPNAAVPANVTQASNPTASSSNR